MVLRPLRSATPSYPDSDLFGGVCVQTMSTSVVNPFAFTEISRIRAMGRRQVDTSALARVRRDLFGPVDHEDTRKFVMRELAVQQSLSSDRWGFDFQREEPITEGPASEKYFWEKVTEDDHVPQAYAHEYTLTAETITVMAEEADVSAAAPTPPASPLEAASSTCTSSPEIMETAKPTVPVVKSSFSSFKRTSILRPSLKRRRKEEVQQKKMTDFLRIRKSTSSMSAAKIRRLSDPTITASSQSTS